MELTSALFSSADLIQGAEAKAANPFWVGYSEARPGWPETLTQQAVMVKKLGYDGMGKLLWTVDLGDVLKAFDSVGLKFSQAYFNANLTLGPLPSGPAPFDPQLEQQLSLLKGRGVQLVPALWGFKASDPVVYARAIEVVRQIADMAGTGTQVLLMNDYREPVKMTVDEALGLAKEVNRPNVGIGLSLFHYLASNKSQEYRPLLARAMPRLKAVAVVGIDDELPSAPFFKPAGKPLGEGAFDMVGFLRALRELGYAGPVVLETERIPGDRREVLQQSMAGWRKLQRRVNEAMSRPTKGLSR
jgi:sugar phosphate isomerase/epimerase